MLHIVSAEFSPEGNRLAVSCDESSQVWIFNVSSKKFLAKIAIRGPKLKFFDNENLLCGSENMLYSININSCEILTCLDFGDIPRPISVCRKRSIVCVGLNYSRNFKLVTVYPPRRSDTMGHIQWSYFL